LDSSRKSRFVIGGFSLLAGLFILLIASRVIAVPEGDVHAPFWVLGLSGLVFVVAGAMAMAGPDSRATAFGAFIICLSFAVLGAWVALFSAEGSISGGIPFLSRESNSVFGRWVFGAGAVISLLVAWMALKQFLRGRNSD